MCVCVCVCIYTHNAVLHLKEWNNAICSNMDGSTDYHTKKSKSDKERQIACDITYMWNLKKKMRQVNICIKQKRRAHKLRKQTLVTKGERIQMGVDKLGVWD